MSLTSKRLLGVVLCGGASKRMGQDKAMLVGSSKRTFLQVAHDRLSKVCDSVCLSASSTNASAYQRAIDCEIIVDPDESYGPITGITQSLSHARTRHFEGCLFNPVDTPALTDDDLLTLLKAYQSTPANVICAIAGSESTRLEPLIAIYPICVLETLQTAIENGHYGLQRVLQQMPVERVTLSTQSCRNINTPTDYSN